MGYIISKLTGVKHPTILYSYQSKGWRITYKGETVVISEPTGREPQVYFTRHYRVKKSNGHWNRPAIEALIHDHVYGDEIPF